MVQESEKKKRKNGVNDNSFNNKSNKVPHSNTITGFDLINSHNLCNEMDKAIQFPFNGSENVTIPNECSSVESMHHSLPDSLNTIIEQENTLNAENLSNNVAPSLSPPIVNRDSSKKGNNTANLVDSDQSENITTKLDTNDVKSQDEVCQWPWIRLMSKAGRPYYYNALTSTTSWFPSHSRDKEEKHQCKPPTLFSAANAQKTWQKFWQQCQDIQKPSKTNCHEEKNNTTGDDAEDSSQPTINKSMAVYIEHYKSPTATMLGRAARQQVRPPNTENSGYVQGFDEYNIWYGKYLSDRREGSRREDREKALTRCNPFTDSGWTRCDMEPQLDRPVLCLYFAKGCCYLGSNCRYYHRLPTAEDDAKLDMLHDIFGRERFASHRDDMDGVGTFTEDCRTLFVGDMKVNRVYSNAEEKTEELIRQQFGLWGPLESIRVIRNKNIAFVRYKYRVHAEFAKVAMAEQRLMLDRSDDQISVRWAHGGRDSSNENQKEISSRDWEQANTATMNRLENLGYTQEEIDCQLKWSIQQKSVSQQNTAENTTAVVSSYPLNTMAHLNTTFDNTTSETKNTLPNSSEQPTNEDDIYNFECPTLNKAFSRIQNFHDENVFKVSL
ncbi:uncharacterized protein LOC128882535 isoform X2 [Hylaeus volcanicus]|uniref:uncharacterized protein LOC128882535 isoform X2 n=1 Tax=Hylaeus volcanicus TaxID=313075 RepID=UPI0023B84F72|nr:uncharacterized protein LOC128882535 isoform X2 [Hylaeus volcanicus]